MAGFLTFSDVVGRPEAARECLSELPNVVVDGMLAWRPGIEFDLTFLAPSELVAAKYGPERARLLVRWDGSLECTPRGPRRTWKHRNQRRGDRDEQWTTGSLCLFYPRDPRPLRWEWDDGLEAYVLRAQRHLFYEEYFRRENEWPVEDAPHGHPTSGTHAIRSSLMRGVVDSWTG